MRKKENENIIAKKEDNNIENLEIPSENDQENEVITPRNKNLIQDIKVNLFEKSCDSNKNSFINCKFEHVKLEPYSKKFANMLKFKINYDFKNCNFSSLNTQFSTYKDHFKVNSGNHNIILNGFQLKFIDSYFWDTNTNEYDKTCLFMINSIETSFSDYTKSELNSYIAIIKDYKIFNNTKEIEHFKEKANSILKNAELIPDFDKTELQEYKNQLSAL